MVQASISVSARDPNVQKVIVDEGLTSEEAGERKPETFEALSASFELTNDEFSERFLPWVRLACLWLQRDHVGAEALLREMVRKGGEVHLDEADQAWTGCAETFAALSELVEAAKVRLAITRTQGKG